MILVTTANGKTGRAVCAGLSALGAAHRLGLRRPDRPDAVALDFQEPASWGPALDGVTALFLLRPPAIADIQSTLAPFISAARAAGVGRIVFLSVMGAESNRFLPHAAVERALMAGPKDWILLRPGFFAQNFQDAYLRDITEDDRLYLPAGQGRVAFVDLRDVGVLAARMLQDPAAPTGTALTLTGPRAVSFAETAVALSEVTGRHIAYVPASPLGYARHLRRRGAPWALVAVQTWLHLGLRWGQAETVDPTLARLLGRPTRDVIDYLRDHADLWTPNTQGDRPC